MWFNKTQFLLQGFFVYSNMIINVLFKFGHLRFIVFDGLIAVNIKVLVRIDGNENWYSNLGVDLLFIISHSDSM